MNTKVSLEDKVDYNQTVRCSHFQEPNKIHHFIETDHNLELRSANVNNYSRSKKKHRGMDWKSHFPILRSDNRIAVPIWFRIRFSCTYVSSQYEYSSVWNRAYIVSLFCFVFSWNSIRSFQLYSVIVLEQRLRWNWMKIQ